MFLLLRMGLCELFPGFLICFGSWWEVWVLVWVEFVD